MTIAACRRAALALLSAAALALLAAAAAAAAPGQTADEADLNRGKAAYHGQRYAEARQRFERVAAAGNADAQYYLGQMAAVGAGEPKDPRRAVQWWEQAARQGHTDAQAAMGSAYLRGLGVTRNLPEAARWSRLAADKGHGGAAYNLAVIYRSGGEGVAQDQPEAERWAKVATSKGFPDAMKVTARKAPRAPEAVAIFEEGQRLYRAGDFAGAMTAFRRCADMGDIPCRIQVGWQHQEGKGGPRNDAEAVRWYQAAADQGDPTAQVNLGNMYQWGRGVRKSCKTAVEWFARAALVNDHSALYSLARMYQFGFGVKEDRAKAHALYKNSAAFGNVKARNALATFNNFVWPDARSRDIYLERVERYRGAIDGCQAQANVERRTVTCLVPIIDWNPKTWEDCNA